MHIHEESYVHTRNAIESIGALNIMEAADTHESIQHVLPHAIGKKCQ